MGYCAASLRPRRAAVFGVFLAIALASLPARAQRVVVGDLAGGSDESGAVTLLLRSMLRSGQRPAVRVEDLMLALQRTPAARQGSLGINRDQASALLKDLGADRLLTGEMTGDARVTLTVRVFATGDAHVSVATVQSVRGDFAQLALAAATAVAADAGLTVTPVDASLAELRPFVRAARALGAGDMTNAAESLRLAGRDVAGRVSAAKDVADVVWRNAQLPADLRIVAALAAGENQEAVKLGRDDKSKSPDVQAQELRAELAASDLAGAKKTLATIKHAKGDAAELARAEYDLQNNKSADAARELTPLLKKTPPSSPALALIASLPPGTLDAKLESLALNAAHGVAGAQPGVASMVGLRAAKGGNQSADAVGLIKPAEMKPMELGDVDKMLEGKGEPSALDKSVVASVQERRTAKVVALKDEGNRPKEEGGKKTAAAADPYASPEVRSLARQLEPLLARFPQLAGDAGGMVVVYPMKGGSYPWSPYWVRRQPLGSAIEYALAAAPRRLGVIMRHEEQSAHPSASDFERIADIGDESAPLVLLYGCTAAGAEAHVELQLYSVADGKLYSDEENIAGESTGLVRLNPILIPLGTVLLVGLLFFGVRRLMRVGEVVIDIKRDPGVEKEMLAIRITTNPKPPAIEDLEKFHKTTRTRHGRMAQFNAPARTSFPRVPVGKYWVHLYGTFQKGGEIRAIPAGISKEIVVKNHETQRVQLELDPGTTEYRVNVTDGEPIAGATIIVDDNRGKPVVTDREGNAIIHLKRGEHVLHVAVKGETFDKEVEVVQHKVQLLTISLAAERRDRERRGGIALSHDENAPKPYLSRPVASARPEPAAHPAATAAIVDAAPVAAVASEPDDDGVSLPEGFQIPNLAQALGAVAKPPAPAAKPPAAATPTATAKGGLGRYRKVAELGRSDVGVVFKAHDTVLDRDVALRILSAAQRADAKMLESFLREGRSLVGLEHPNLVTVFDQGVEAGEPFQVTELISGQTLDALMRTRGVLPMDELLAIADQICVGLAFAHDKRILHRNLKPASIFLGSDGSVKIGDFAVAPEQLRGDTVDVRSDLYSVGCTLFHMACGRTPPASGAKPSSLNSDVHPDFDRLVQRCLEPDPAARVASAEELRKLLRPLKAIYC
jgi:hypothetical protein